MRGFSFALVRTMESIILSFVLLLYAILPKSQALHRKFTSATVRLLLDSTSPSLLRNATARVAAPSVCFAAARILLAAAPTAPPCFRHWRRSSPLLPKGEALAGRFTSYWTTEARYGVKGWALLAGAAASGQRSLSSCRWPRQRSTAASEILCFARPDES